MPITRIKPLAQPAHGEYTEQPDVEAQHEDSEQQSSGHHSLVRVVQWPLHLTIALIEIAWLLSFAYAAHRFVLEPILGEESDDTPAVAVSGVTSEEITDRRLP